MNHTVNNGSWTDMGNVCTNPRGEYDVNTMYNFLDVVSMDGGSYICLQDQTIGVNPVRNTSNERWFCMAVSGSADREFLALKEQVSKDAERATEAANAAAENQTKTAEDVKESTKVKEAALKIKEDAENIKDTIAGYARTSGENATKAETAARKATDAVTGFDTHVNAEKEKATTDINEKTSQHAQTLQTRLDQNKQTIVNEATAAVNAVIDQRKAEINDTAVEEIKKVQTEGVTQTKKVADEATKQIADIRAAGGTLESAVERYYAMRRGKDIYTVEVLDSTTTQACTVNRLDGLAGLVCEPSTNTTKGRDDVGALDAFRPTLCNWVLDAEGNQHITALQGMANYTEEGKVNVGVLNMGLYYKKERNEADTGWLHHWSMLPRKEEGYKPMKECVRPDNTVQGWMIHPRGACVDIEGVPYGCNGVPKRKGPSFSDYAYPRKQGPAYCYETDVDAAWVLALTMIKYGTRNLQEYMKGCTSYSNQYQVSQAENGVKRVILTTSQANAFVVGSCVSVGNLGDQSNRDRYCDYMHNIADSAVVLGIEVVDDTHSALVLDVDRSFDVPTTAWVSAMHWRSGSTSKVQGYDGSPVSNTDSKNICKINEIEILNGGWNVCGNSMNIMETSQEGVTTIANYRTDSSLLLTTNLDTVITTWKKTGTIPVTDNAWKYILDQNLDFAEGIMIPELYGGGERTGYADGYHTGQNPAAGQKTARELLRRGNLYNGSICGPSSVRAAYALSYSYWYILGSLSPNAVRGEWQATP